MVKITNVKNYSGGLEKAVHYIHDKWGSKDNYLFYKDAIFNSTDDKGKLPKFFLMLEEDEIIGCYALLVNDIISRQDLLPWFACLFIEETHRGNRLCQVMFDHAETEVRAGGYNVMFLTTDHAGLYEKFGWERIEDGYGVSGNQSRIYRLYTSI